MMGILYGIVDEQEWLGTICYQLWWAHVMLGENLKINSKIIWRKDLFNNLIRNYGRDWIICFHRNHLLWKYILFSTQSQHMFSWSEYIGIGVRELGVSTNKETYFVLLINQSAYPSLKLCLGSRSIVVSQRSVIFILSYNMQHFPHCVGRIMFHILVPNS